MRIRDILLIAFLISALVPTAVLGWWSYNRGIEQEFAEVEDRHLLLARNVSAALSRYHTDLIGTFDSFSQSMLQGETPKNLEALMKSINLICVLIVDEATGEVIARADQSPEYYSRTISPVLFAKARSIATDDETVFSEVMSSAHAGNIMLGVRRYGDKLSIAVVNTDYFVQLGASISFGKKGHAAIVDHLGNVLAHPKPSWIAERKNIAQVSSVARMMRGETGIETFYSPALKGDMIAGLTTVEGPGWGVMIPQPVSEIYEKVRDKNNAVMMAVTVSLTITLALVMLFVNSLAAPLEKFLASMKLNARNRTIGESSVRMGLIPVREVTEFKDNYNSMARQITEANDRMRHVAYTCSVTGLPNREHLREMAQTKFLIPNALRSSGVLAFVDIDNFKQINDVHGHDVGDTFLRDVAGKLRGCMAECAALTDTKQAGGLTPVVARIGGDEFVIIFPGLTHMDNIRAFLTLVQNRLSEQGDDLPVINRRGASIGCARYPQDGKTLDGLLKCADIAMYHAKKNGKDSFEIYSKDIGIMTAAELRSAAEEGIAKGEMVLEYQPKIAIGSGNVTGVEALVRWDHPKLGRLAPDLWIPAISNSPIIRQLGEWVVAQAMDDHGIWKGRGLDMSVAVNIGAEHFCSAGFTKWITACARERGFDTRCMEIEVTENTLFSSDTAANTIMNELHAAGFKLSIDDFGTGYSNIARLSKLPVDCLKIDRSIIAQADKVERVGLIMECIVTMAKRLGCSTVAEGVETASELAFAARSGICMVQGFYYAPSLPVDQLVDWVRTHDDLLNDTGENRKKIVAA